MQRFTLQTLIISIMLYATNAQAQYCSASSTGTNGDYYVATVVTTGGTTNIDHTGGSGTDYYLSVDQTLTIPAGGTFNIATTAGGTNASGGRVVIYIDYNGDEDFEDAGELVGAMSPEKVWRDPVPTDDNMDITVPATANVGTTKMRIFTGDAWAYNDDMTGADPDGPGIPATPCGDLNHASFKDFNVQIETALGIDDFEQDIELSVFPNPIQGDAINLKMNVQNQDVTMDLYNILGDKIYSGALKSFNTQDVFQLPQLRKGVYLMKISVDNKIHTRRIIK